MSVTVYRGLVVGTSSQCSTGVTEVRHLLAQAAQAKPSVGLEPTTPSLPWKDGGVSSVHGRSLAGTKCLQIARSRVNGRGGRNPAEVKLVDGMWTENQ